jgi:hypothetical protein
VTAGRIGLGRPCGVASAQARTASIGAAAGLAAAAVRSCAGYRAYSWASACWRPRQPPSGLYRPPLERPALAASYHRAYLQDTPGPIMAEAYYQLEVGVPQHDQTGHVPHRDPASPARPTGQRTPFGMTEGASNGPAGRSWSVRAVVGVRPGGGRQAVLHLGRAARSCGEGGEVREVTGAGRSRPSGRSRAWCCGASG